MYAESNNTIDFDAGREGSYTDAPFVLSEHLRNCLSVIKKKSDVIICSFRLFLSSN